MLPTLGFLSPCVLWALAFAPLYCGPSVYARTGFVKYRALSQSVRVCREIALRRGPRRCGKTQTEPVRRRLAPLVSVKSGVYTGIMARSALSTRKPRGAPPVIPIRDAAEPRKGRLHQYALGMLREMIQSGEIPPGERLMEKPMSERLGMSRTPVREAFRTLAVEGLVNLLPNQGVVVAELDKEKSGDVCLLLGALESFAARQACQRITVRQQEELRTLQDRLERYYEAADRARYTETNRAIHRLMVEASRNPSLISVWSMIIPRAERARSLKNIDPKRWASSIDSHRKIFAALMARDGDLLSSLMQAHFAHVIIDSMEDAREAAQPREAASAADAPSADLTPRIRRKRTAKA